MDADYLKGTVGDALAAALTSLALKQPKDPLEFLGKYLIKYADYLDADAKKADVLKALELQQAELAAGKEKEKEAAEELVAQGRLKQQQEEAKVESLSNTTDAQVIYGTVLPATKEATGATNVYLGKKIDMPEAASYIKYVAGTQGNEFMVGKVLKGAVPGSEEGEGEEGVTFRMWKELPPAPVEEEDPAAEQQEDAPPKPPAFPAYVHIENVVREPGIKFFGVPKLAAYLAVPVTYASGLHDEGIGATPTPAEGDPVPEIPPGTPMKVTKPVQLVLGLDTFDQARKFTHDQIATGLRWAFYLANALEKADAKLWDQELERVQAMAAEEKDLRAVVSTELKDKVGEGAKALEGLEDGAIKKLKEKQQAFDAVKSAVLGSAKPYLSKLSSLLIKPKALHFFKLAQVALTLTKASATVSADDLAQWECVRLLLGTPFWSKVAELSPSEEDAASLLKRTDIEKIRALLDGVTESDLEGGAVESLLLFKWVTSFLDLTEAIYDKQEADAAAAAAAAEAAAAAAEE